MSASTLPIPQPPRTPSPLEDEDVQPLPNDLPQIPQPSLLDPYGHTRFPGVQSVGWNTSQPGDGALTPILSPRSSNPDLTQGMGLQTGPFNFQPTTYTAGGNTPVRSNVGQRRGHKYKHSSISHQIFLEPTARKPLRLPASLPIPTRQEGWRSMSREQTVRVAWCFCHLFIAGYVQWTAQGSLSLTALSHLIFYDAIGAFLCAGVEVLSNFEVWKRPTIRLPFGLERTEVLIGFAMSILLMFMGFDLLSHSAGHFLSELGDHEPHRSHNHTRVSPGSIDLVSVLAILSTVVSALMLKNHARMAKSMRFAKIAFLPSVLNNPSHLLTIGCATFLLLLPLLSFEMYNWIDRALSAFIALLMCLLGVQLVKTLGSMLLMSYSERHEGEIASVLQDIEKDANVKQVEEAKFWQVHYGLCMANLKLRVKGGGEDVGLKLRERVTSLVKNRLGGGYGGSEGTKWEVSTQLCWKEIDE